MIKKGNSQKLKTSLKKAKSLLTTIEKMVDDEKNCIEIAQQINASIGILRSANATMLKNHLETCGVKKMRSLSAKTRSDFISELVQTFAISTRK